MLMLWADPECTDIHQDKSPIYSNSRKSKWILQQRKSIC